MTAAEHLRARMVDALVASGRVLSGHVEEALRAVPRHLFLPGVGLPEAYADEAVAVQHVDGAATSSASQPSMVAIMLEQLALRPGHRVLEVGAGTGWNAALMARIVGPGGRVTAVDIDPGLIDSAGAHLIAAGEPGIELVCADGAFGHPPGAPYDRIVLTVGSADVRPEWVAQLAPGGRLLVPLAVRGSQLSIAFDLGPDGALRSDSVRGCSFIRLRGIGAGPTDVASLPGGAAVQVAADGPGVDVAAVATALLDPGEPLTSGVSLGPEDVWDGFGFWLALTEPGAARLLPTADGAPGPTVAVISPPGAPSPGVATVESDGATVRPYGPAGEALAARLLASLDAWAAAGCRGASSWRIQVTPASGPPPLPDGVFVRLPLCWLSLSLMPPGRG